MTIISNYNRNVLLFSMTYVVAVDLNYIIAISIILIFKRFITSTYS